jgi:UDP-N-acetylmuramate dehydrogenase
MLVSDMGQELFSTLARESVPLAPFTWLNLGGVARYFAEPADESQLQQVVAWAASESIPVRILGGGSNLLVRDPGFDGLVIQLNSPAFDRIAIDGNVVRCGGGVRLSHLVTACVAQGLAGVEHLVGIPGTVGGALHGNSGTDEGDIGQVVRAARLMKRDGNVVQIDAQDLAFSHRRSSLDELVILEASLSLKPDDAVRLTKREQTFWIVKRGKQPNAPVRSAIAFVDPDGGSASAILSQCGALGMIEGGVQLSMAYPNYLIASEGATATQVLTLLDRARQLVYDRQGLKLQPHLVVW